MQAFAAPMQQHLQPAGTQPGSTLAATAPGTPAAATAARPTTSAVCPTADIAGLFGGSDPGVEEDDPVEPFTLFGSTFKQFLIEMLDGDKIVARKRGFTVDTCVAAMEASQETPAFQGLSAGDKVLAAGNVQCKRAVGADLKPACASSCQLACSASLSGYEAAAEAQSGYKLPASDRARVLKTCQRSCAVECAKSGKAHDFAAPFRR